MTTTTFPSASFVRNLYARMLLTRLVDECAQRLHEQKYIDVVASCHGHEAAQVGSAVCIEVGKDFTLPYYRDLGVVLTIGMTPYEVFRTYLQTHQPQTPGRHDYKQSHSEEHQEQRAHWGYHKHNMVTGPAPVATQILHAAGIAFACKLRRAPVVTVAYCGDGIVSEPDFFEGIRFAAQHQLPAVFVCEQDCTQTLAALTNSTCAHSMPSCTHHITLPGGLTHQRIDGTDVITVYTAMQTAMQHARDGHGPILLEMYVTRSRSERSTSSKYLSSTDASLDDTINDPLLHCQRFLQERGAWDPEWATQLYARLSTEVEQAMHDAVRDNS